MNIATTTGTDKDSPILYGMARDFYDGKKINLIERWVPVGEWLHDRGKHGLEPYQKSTVGRIAPTVVGYLRNGAAFSGVNFASQDYLSLSSHSALIDAAQLAADTYGVHSAGSSILMGNSALSIALEQRLELFLDFKECTVFPTGWTAGFGTVKMLAQAGDHIIIDILAHACLQEGADCSGAKVHRFPHLSNEAVERRLRRIRSVEPTAGILVVTETLFSMNSDSPDIAELQAICTSYGATLLVDCAHDLGCLGPGGRGILEIQSMVGKVDVLIGAFSKTFASIGGFVATNHPGFRSAMRACCGPQTFTNAMTPIQAAVILAAINIVDSAEGAELRAKLMHNVVYMRRRLTDNAFRMIGDPSAIIPVVIGDSGISRHMTNHMSSNGAIVNLVESPAVARNQSRWRLQVMAAHTEQHIDLFIERAIAAVAAFSPDAAETARLSLLQDV